jgi:ketosteroid isomerase-like protein
VEIVRRAFELWEIAFERGTDDFSALLGVFDDDVITRRLSPGPDPGTWYGRDGLLTVLTEWLETFDEFRMRGEEFIDAGDEVMVRIAQEARGDGSGVPVAATFWFVLGVREGKIATFDMYFTRDQAVDAAGLEE